MDKKINNGRCYICKEVLNSRQITRHLSRCIKSLKEIDDAAVTNVYHISASGYSWYYELFDTKYFLHFLISGDSLLYDIDSFLRDIWVECCGHLSAFEIDKIFYKYQVFDEDFWYEDEPKDMDIKLDKVLYKGLKFSYEYDFGSTTSLRLKVHNVYKGKLDKVKLIARNVEKVVSCYNCSKKAKYISLEEDIIPLCEDCAENYEEEYLMPIVNSPRVGVCAYTGDNSDY